MLPRAVLTVALVAAAPLLSACAANETNNSDVVAGKQLFVQKCGSCHTLSRADTKGTQGPNLDQAFQQSQREGFGETAIRGVVYKQILYPAKGGVMPAKLLTGDQAHDVAAYVASVTGRSGKDTGLLARAVKAAGGGTATEKAGVLTIPADPQGRLAYAADKAIGTAGPVKVSMPNQSGTPHNIAIDGVGKSPIVAKGDSSFEATLKAGTYTYYCQVPGHKEAGMQGTLTVK